MLHLLWNMFTKTGQINTYMFYKALEQENMDADDETDVPGTLSEDTTVGFFTPLEEHA